MKVLIFSLIFLLSYLFYSCKKDSVYKESSCFQVNLFDANQYKIENNWILLGFLDTETKNEICKPESLKEMNIEFMNNNKFHANSSCNSIFGDYSISNPDSIKFTNMNTTLIFCINDTVREWEEKLWTGLKDATNFDITGNRLIIITKNDLDMVLKIE